MTNEKMCYVVNCYAKRQNVEYDLEQAYDQECDRQLRCMIAKNHYCFKNDYDMDNYFSEVKEDVWIYAGSFDPKQGSFSTWFSKVAKNKYYKMYKKNCKDARNIPMYEENEEHEQINVIDQYCAEKSAEDVYFQQVDQENILCLVDKLNENYRNAIKLVCLENMKPQEAAEELHTSSACVSTWLNRGRKKLKSLMEEEIEFDR